MKFNKNFIFKFLLIAKILSITLLFIVGFLIKSPDKHYFYYAENNTPLFAKIETDCPLFKTENTLNTAPENIYFLIPKTYFVCIISQQQNATKVRYLNFIGYCKTTQLKTVSFVPTNPYLLGVSFNINSSSGTQIRSTPTIDNNVLANVSAGAKNITYIASTHGQTPSGGQSDIWYYCEFSPEYSPTQVYSGYIYSERAEIAPTVLANSEADNNEENPNISSDISAENEYENVEISPGVKAILIALICVPIIAIFCIVVIKHKIALKNQKAMETNSNYSALNSSQSNLNKSSITSKIPVKFFKNKTFYKKPPTNNTLLTSRSFSLDDLDDDDNDLL